jgi:hypothetical protein|tara:strand:- start:412 stop:831 length:420 start_codon:yes stop_codon:yes gene_type:complete
MASAIKTFFNPATSSTGSGMFINANKTSMMPNSSKSNAWVWMHVPPDGTATIDEMWVWITNGHASYNNQFGVGKKNDTGDNTQYNGYAGRSNEMRFPTNSPPWLLLSGVLIQDDTQVLGIKNSQWSYGTWFGYVNRITN